MILYKYGLDYKYYLLSHYILDTYPHGQQYIVFELIGCN